MLDRLADHGHKLSISLFSASLARYFFKIIARELPSPCQRIILVFYKEQGSIFKGFYCYLLWKKNLRGESISYNKVLSLLAPTRRKSQWGLYLKWENVDTSDLIKIYTLEKRRTSRFCITSSVATDCTWSVHFYEFEFKLLYYNIEIIIKLMSSHYHSRHHHNRSPRSRSRSPRDRHHSRNYSRRDDRESKTRKDYKESSKRSMFDFSESGGRRDRKKRTIKDDDFE